MEYNLFASAKLRGLNSIPRSYPDSSVLFRHHATFPHGVRITSEVLSKIREKGVLQSSRFDTLNFRLNRVLGLYGVERAKHMPRPLMSLVTPSSPVSSWVEDMVLTFTEIFWGILGNVRLSIVCFP